MIIDIPKLNADGERFTGEDPGAILGLEQEPDMEVCSPVRYDLWAQPVSDRLVVKGSVAVDVALRCSRCAEVFRATLRDPRFECVRDVVDKQGVVDLTPEVRETIILSFPNHPICRSDCRGLCSRCGANLNQERCACGREPPDPQWRALDNLEI